jgi:hypothetical protein
VTLGFDTSNDVAQPKVTVPLDCYVLVPRAPDFVRRYQQKTNRERVEIQVMEPAEKTIDFDELKRQRALGTKLSSKIRSTDQGQASTQTLRVRNITFLLALFSFFLLHFRWGASSCYARSIVPDMPDIMRVARMRGGFEFVRDPGHTFV